MAKSQLLKSSDVRARYRVTDMALWRWVNHPTMGFPQPIYINRRRYWREADLDAFDARCEKASAVA